MLGMNVILIFEIILIELFLLKSWKVALEIEPLHLASKLSESATAISWVLLCLTFNNIIMYSPF